MYSRHPATEFEEVSHHILPILMFFARKTITYAPTDPITSDAAIPCRWR
jgi:hypothetical protein